MMNALQIEMTKTNNYLIKIDEYSGVLREYLYKDIVKVNKNEEALIEIFMENMHRKYDIFDEIPPIPDIYLENHQFFIRITSINKMHTYNNKFRFDQVLTLYRADSITNKVELLTSKKKLTLAKVGLLCKYMIYKINSWNLVNMTNDAISKQTSLNQETMLPWIQYELKLNCNFDIQTRIDDKHMFIDKILIFRAILSLKPIQMVSIAYNENKDYFICYIYDHMFSWLLEKKIKMNDILSNIPHVRTFLKSKLYNELGRRIYKNYKNSLLIFSYMHKNH